MNNFRIILNKKESFKVTEYDFYYFCEQSILQICEKLQCAPYKLPQFICTSSLTQIDEVDELFKNYFMYKYLASEFDFELMDKMDEIEIFITRLLELKF